MKCRNCKKTKFDKIIKIGLQPISSRTYKSKIKLKKYPLDLFKCKHCKLIQLSRVAPAKDMYGSGYGYWTGLSPLMINHMKKKVKRLNNSKQLKKFSRVLDIGSSDPTFLNLLRKSKNNLDLFAIDPSSAKFKKSFTQKKINLIVDYFSKKKIDDYLKLKNISLKKFSLITSFAMFYDINDPNSFCKDVKNMLEDNGIWIVEFSYFPLLLKNLTYDQINHEHVTYYTLTTLKNILNKNGLKILDINFNDINGGSAEVTVSKNSSKHKPSKERINSILKEESFINFESYKKFNLRLDNVKKVVNNFLENNKKVVGYGASTKGNIILNHCGIKSDKIKHICDGNIQKIGNYTPGSNIKIITKKRMRKMKPDYLFVLIWSFRSEVIKQEKKFLLNGGKLIFPLPIFHIIDKYNYKYYQNENLNSLGYSI
jgi:NDP-4-keto-2,6-dideoxyhexose 3-C-methyltransferase|tara:strand:- start:247 stop:1524 length:1278 start_codon:yes stop_codon:yes gene_type:complete